MMPQGENGVAYKSLYLVLTNDRTDSPITIEVAMAAYIPPGSWYTWGGDVDLWAFAQAVPEIKLREEKPGFEKAWEVVVTHKTPEEQKKCSDRRFENPLDEPWEFEYDSDETTKFADKDNIGKPIVNSSKEPFRTKECEVFQSRGKLTLRKNLAAVNWTAITLYMGGGPLRKVVNNDTLTILGMPCSPRTLLMRSIKVTRRFYGLCTPYYPHTFVMDYDPDTHDLVTVDAGRRRLKANGNANVITDYEWITDARQNVISTPQLLDGSGGVLAPNNNAVVLPPWRYYAEQPFSVLGFPS